jgi:type II secretory pathway pseudopilin PulG
VTRSRAQRGALLLEVVAAVAIFVMAGAAILSLVGGSVDSLAAARDAVKAVDLARSAMARLEAGLDTPQSLPGPVSRWEDDADAVLGDDRLAEQVGTGFSDALPRPSPWEIEVETEPAQFTGLTLVTVRALKRPAPDSEQIEASYTLRQLVRLSGKGEDRAGDLEEVVKEER